MLPHGFILGVVIPLNFAHSNDFDASHSFSSIQNLDWAFTVGQITTKVKLFHWQLLLWYSQALLKL
jgi:hypothetical protein